MFHLRHFHVFTVTDWKQKIALDFHSTDNDEERKGTRSLGLLAATYDLAIAVVPRTIKSGLTTISLG